MLEYFCLGLKYGAAVAGGLVSLALAGFIALGIGWVIGMLMQLADATDDDDEGGD